jgi:outer membrane receptor protein involved in Fe transport
MDGFLKAGLRAALATTTILGGTALIVVPAAAQTTTATVRGQVTDAAGTPVAGATVVAVNSGTNQTYRTTTDANGRYSLNGVQAASYKITVTGPNGAIFSQFASVGVAQNASLDVTLGAAAVADTEATTSDIIVTASPLSETRTSEIGTNVTRTQIENLPQNNRNFLNFANLAPGITVNNADTRRTFAGGGISTDPNGESLGGPQVNVFIDGVSLKSNLQQGGIVGQDGSRGNPFSQLAVQEFRVITSNYKAEYEDAGTAIITAITKSGTNEFHGDLFGTYQSEGLIERDFFQKKNNQPKPDLKRYQFGAALGGPIIKDKLFFFATYEGNIQNRSSNVIPNGDAARQALFESASGLRLADYRGAFSSPFREHLGFGKLTWQANDHNLVELTGSIRKETELRDFGGDTARSRGTNITNDTYTGKLRWQLTTDSFVNELAVDYLKLNLAFGNAAGTEFGRNYDGVINIGGRPDFQNVKQSGLTFRDDVTFTNFGAHTLKAGVKISLQKYDVGGSGPFANPLFNFRIDAANNLDFTQPSEVNFGVGNPQINAKTTQIGLFLQDDWQANDKLLLNVGLRWDYDSNSKNNKFVTPAAAAAALRALGADPRIGNFYKVEDYISTGNNRKAPLNQFQPRIGFSYDLNGDQRTVLFGGYGRYYDRVLFRNAAEESLFTQYQRGNIQFSRDGLPRNGQPTVQFQPQYLTPAGLAALRASLANNPTSPGTSELRVIPNDLKSPHTDQFALGVRQRFGVVRTSLSYNYIIGTDQVGYAPLNRTVATNAGGFYDFIPLINGYSNAVAAFNTRATRYHGIYFTADKPYTKRSGFGVGIAYTASFSKERGFSFNFDFPNIAARPFVPNSGDVRHKLVLNGIGDLPLGFQISGLATISSPQPFFVIDASAGFGARDIQFPGNIGKLPAFVQVDLRLKKDVHIFGNNTVSLTAEIFNLFNRANFGGADGFIPPGGNTNFGVPNGLSGPPRSFQFGAAYKF